MCAIFALRGGALTEMVEQPYASESVLQRLLADTPELLSAEAPESERRRWLLVRREMGVADREEGSDRWSLDHLFVDEECIPTLVEVKRSSDTRLRREVVGQMLDYAANAPRTWDAGRLQSNFESRFETVDAAEQELSRFLEDEMEPQAFWDTVAGNLKERRLRLVFVADRIPRELRSIVEFLNEQLSETEVLAVEIKQYGTPGSDHLSVVPRVIGETEMARRAKKDNRRRPPRGDEREFYDAIRNQNPPELAERMLTLYEHAKQRSSRVKFGRSPNPTTTVWLGEHEDSAVANPVALRFWSDGDGIAIPMRHFRTRRTTAEMERLIELLRTLPGTADALDDAVTKGYRTFCTFSAKHVLVDDAAVERFKSVLEEASVRASDAESSSSLE